MRITKIEELGGENRALRQCVDALLDQKKPLHVIRRALKKKFKVELSEVAIGHYRDRFEEELEKVREKKRRFLAILEIIGEKGLDAAATAKLWEATDAMKPDHLIKIIHVGQERDKLKLATQELENKTQELQMKLEEVERGREHDRKRVAKAVAEAGSANTEEERQEVLRSVREIFGLSSEVEEESAPQPAGS